MLDAGEELARCFQLWQRLTSLLVIAGTGVEGLGPAEGMKKITDRHSFHSYGCPSLSPRVVIWVEGLAFLLGRLGQICNPNYFPHFLMSYFGFPLVPFFLAPQNESKTGTPKWMPQNFVKGVQKQCFGASQFSLNMFTTNE